MGVFYMTVGLPGSGKSFYANSISGDKVTIHSSDAIRSEILGDVSDQTQQELVFKTLHERVLRDLENGKDVVYDATNLNYKRRMAFLDRVRALHKNIYTVCLFMVTPYQTCLQRNQSRDRRVPESVMQRMYHSIDVPMYGEGWDAIWIIEDKENPMYILDLLARLSKLEHDNPHHQFTVGQHSMAAALYLTHHYHNYSVPLFYATLLHDIGKEKTKVFKDSHGEPSEVAHFYDHERVGAYDSFLYTGDCKFTNEERILIATMIRWHMWPYVVEKSDNPNKTKKKVTNLLGENIWKQIMVLNDCDRHAH